MKDIFFLYLMGPLEDIIHNGEKLMRANDALEKLMEKKNVVFTECNKNLAKGKSVEEASTWAVRNDCLFIM